MQRGKDMKHFYVMNFNRKRRIISLIILAFCIAVLLIFKPVQVFHVFSKSGESALTKGNEKEKNIALTFNISWGDEKVLDILKVLKNNKTRATFFVSGEWAEKHPQILEKIREDKHEIGMLGYRYTNYLEMEMDQVRKDMVYAKEIFKKLGYKDISYIRPPNGQFDEDTIELANDLDLEVIHWSVNPHDWENPGVTSLHDYLKKNMSNGDIVLLHASDSAKQTAKVLQKVIPEMQKKKKNFVTISELMNEVTMEEKIVK
jgi:polysaccharide deacetylase family sporulation protein PdaB